MNFDICAKENNDYQVIVIGAGPAGVAVKQGKQVRDITAEEIRRVIL